MCHCKSHTLSRYNRSLKKIKQELQNRINDTIAKNTNKGLWHSLTKLKVSDCKLGDIVFLLPYI
jgi:site-specific recombinase XerD